MRNRFENIVLLMFEKYGIDISFYDESFLEKTIHGRMGLNSIFTEDDYYHNLSNDSGEALLFNDSLSNFHSEFFRNPLTFALLEQVVFPRIFNERAKNHIHEVRIWSAGCAAGQEPYSLAVIAEDLKNDLSLPISYLIFATDKSLKQLGIARQGTYDFHAVQNVSLNHVKKYFSNSENSYTINDCIKQQVDFSPYDLLDQESSSPASSIYGDFDLIMCSNLLFYYKPEIQKSILSKFMHSMRPGGFLVTGEAEKSIVKAYCTLKQLTSTAPIFVNN
jgi:chemotaxis protein methyltransferase CheR